MVFEPFRGGSKTIIRWITTSRTHGPIASNLSTVRKQNRSINCFYTGNLRRERRHRNVVQQWQRYSVNRKWVKYATICNEYSINLWLFFFLKGETWWELGRVASIAIMKNGKLIHCPQRVVSVTSSAHVLCEWFAKDRRAKKNTSSNSISLFKLSLLSSEIMYFTHCKLI